MNDPTDLPSLKRRGALAAIAGFGATNLFGCGGGGPDADTAGATAASSSSSAATAADASSDSSLEVSSALSNAAKLASPQPWIWVNAGTSTTATVPTIADFVTVIGSGSVTYAFHEKATSSTTDPVTGVAADTSSSATLAPYLMGKYEVTNANWMAFCNAKGSSYYPTTSKTSGQYWSGGSYPAGKENHPVFFVSYTSAVAYCAWLETQIPGYRFYVPTEGEWEYAALGTHTGYAYPWGAQAGLAFNASTGTLTTLYTCNVVCAAWLLTQAASSSLTYYNNTSVATLADGTALVADAAPVAKVLSLAGSGSLTGWQYGGSASAAWADFVDSDQFAGLVNLYGGYTTPVSAYEGGKSWCGCYDMAGNAYEWTSTVNTSTRGAESGTSANCVKGGSWYATAASGVSTYRGEGRSASGAFHSVGFRVAARPR